MEERVTFRRRHQTVIKDPIVMCGQKASSPLQILPAYRFLSLFPFKKKPSLLFVNRESIVEGRMRFSSFGPYSTKRSEELRLLITRK